MAIYLPLVATVLVLAGTVQSISSKTDFIEEQDSLNASDAKDDDMEVKHTIVVSTKLRNNNHRVIDGTATTGKKITNEDSGEVPVVRAYKSIETTQIRTPDTRHKATFKPVPLSRNPRDELDIYPNLALSPMQWKPSSFYNNNWSNQDGYSTFNRRFTPDYQTAHTRQSIDGLKGYCYEKCMELNTPKGTTQQRRGSWLRNETPKRKIDGKIAKLN